MKLHGEWLVLAERVIRDAGTGNVTLVSCFSQVAALAFPTQHHGFAVAVRYRCADAPPTANQPVQLRLVRHSEVDGEEVVQEWNVEWPAGHRQLEVGTNFRVLRLRRAESVVFRVDSKVGRSAWRPGPSSVIEVVAMPMTPEQRSALQKALAEKGLPANALEGGDPG